MLGAGSSNNISIARLGISSPLDIHYQSPGGMQLRSLGYGLRIQSKISDPRLGLPPKKFLLFCGLATSAIYGILFARWILILQISPNFMKEQFASWGYVALVAVLGLGGMVLAVCFDGRALLVTLVLAQTPPGTVSQTSRFWSTVSLYLPLLISTVLHIAVAPFLWGNFSQRAAVVSLSAIIFMAPMLLKCYYVRSDRFSYKPMLRECETARDLGVEDPDNCIPSSSGAHELQPYPTSGTLNETTEYQSLIVLMNYLMNQQQQAADGPIDQRAFWETLDDPGEIENVHVSVYGHGVLNERSENDQMLQQRPVTS